MLFTSSERPFLDKKHLVSVTHALVRCQLDGCNAIYMGLPLKITPKLQVLQNASADPAFGLSRLGGSLGGGWQRDA